MTVSSETGGLISDRCHLISDRKVFSVRGRSCLREEGLIPDSSGLVSEQEGPISDRKALSQR